MRVKQPDLPMEMPIPFRMRRRLRRLARLALWLGDLDPKTLIVMAVLMALMVTFPTLVLQPLGTRWRAIEAERRCKDWYYDGIQSKWNEPFACVIGYRDTRGDWESFVFDIDLAPDHMGAAKILKEARDRGDAIPPVSTFQFTGDKDQWQKEL